MHAYIYLHAHPCTLSHITTQKMLYTQHWSKRMYNMNCLYIIPDNDNHCILDDLFNTTVVETTDVFPLRKSHPISNVHCAHCRTGAKAGDGGGEGAESFSIHNTIFRKTVCIRYWVFLTVCVWVFRSVNIFFFFLRFFFILFALFFTSIRALRFFFLHFRWLRCGARISHISCARSLSLSIFRTQIIFSGFFIRVFVVESHFLYCVSLLPRFFSLTLPFFKKKN